VTLVTGPSRQTPLTSATVDRDQGQPELGSAAVLVPVKAFADAKVRLASALPAAQRAALAEAMAAKVLAACGSLVAAVVCDDRGVAGWARAHGALVVWEPGRGLNGAVEAGVLWLADHGVTRVVVAHADLPRAVGLEALSEHDGITLVPDQRADGTNVVSIPSRSGFRFAYGPGSFVRHQAEAHRLGLPVTIVRDPSLAYDVDVPADLAGLAGTEL
jgi:2-phospho-L-lactate guanylyltransferase